MIEKCPNVVIHQNITIAKQMAGKMNSLQFQTKDVDQSTLLSDTKEFISPSNILINTKKSTTSVTENGVSPETLSIFTENTGPEWHNVTNYIVTKPIVSRNLPKIFKDFPIFGKPENNADLPTFKEKACQEFVGLTDNEYQKVKTYCSTDLLFTGRELKMSSPRPTLGLLSAAIALRDVENAMVAIPEKPTLHTLKKLKTRVQMDVRFIFPRRLKYRGVRLLSLLNQEKPPVPDTQPPDLEPGKDVLYRVRVYRPFFFSQPNARRNEGGGPVRGRHSVFNCDIMVLGRQTLAELRDRIVCRNDMDLRVDMSENPNLPPPTNSKDSFPSNFMFINNVFYVDNRPHCKDLSEVVREFAESRGLGTFPVRDMAQVTLQEINVRIAYPDVYVHQGSCEHIFQFSEIRLLNYSDPLHLSNYPCHTAVSQNQTLYCNTCAEFSARWIVTKSQRVPFDPAFFCDTCFNSYMYKDGNKVEDFKAYLYKGNEINVLRPNMEQDLDGDESTVVPKSEVRIHF